MSSSSSALSKGKSSIGSASGSAKFEILLLCSSYGSCVCRVQAKGKFSSSSSAAAAAKRATTTSTTRGRKKAEKKVYSLPGQKFDPPEEREPLRIFYESLSKQIPSSEMAEFWLMEHGLLSPERAKKAYERKLKRQQQVRMGTPIKPIARKDRPESSKKPAASSNVDSKAKKRVDYSDDDNDFIVKMKRSRG
ncbi:hypothetical protein HU200_020739 [Digitaria exilis]|uniref:Uncharacterized protein n=1 Tax=Digitaria exilis TaxID=1010633 RepID=A0A835F0T0_9POAL|nr:hypothetical protein HU200_020739 [Digitaria exilis]